MAKRFELLSDKYISVRHTMGSTAASDGDHVTLGDASSSSDGFLLQDAPANTLTSVVIQADRVRVMKPNKSQTFAVGNAVFYTTTSGSFFGHLTTTGGAGKKLIGIAAQSAAAGTDHLYVVFDGRANYLKA